MATSIQDRNGNLLVDPNLDIARGAYQQVAVVNKFGRNSAVAIGVEEEVWDGSVAYTFPATALMTSLSQTTDQAALQGATIELMGLDANWELVTQNALLDAADTTTVVTLTTPLIRCFRVKVLAATACSSSIRVHNAGETVDYAIILAGNNQTLMAIYTVPAGKTAYMTGYYSSVNPGTNLDPTSMPVRLWHRDNTNGYAPHIKHIMGIVNGIHHHEFKPYYKIAQKTDVYLTAQPVGKAADVSAGFDLILVDNDRNW